MIIITQVHLALCTNIYVPSWLLLLTFTPVVDLAVAVKLRPL